MKKINNLIFKLAICLFIISLPKVLMAQCSVIAGNDTTICQNRAFVRTAVVTPPGATIQWFLQGNSTNILSTTSTINIVLSSSGVFNYIIKVSSGSCTKSDTVEVTVNPSPRVNAGLNQSTCQEGVLNLTASVAPSSASINWYLLGSTTSLGTTTSYSVPTTTAGTFNYVIKADSASTCSTFDTVQVVVNPKPVANFTFIVSCGKRVKFTSTSATTSGTITNYQWNFGASGNNNTSNQQNPNHNYSNTPSTYQVQLIVTNSFGCKDTIIKPVTTNTSLEASLSGSPAPQPYNGLLYFRKCTPQSIITPYTFFNNSPTAALNTTSTIIWGDATPNTVISNWQLGAAGQIAHSYSIGDYFLKLVVSNGTCSDTATYGVYLGSNPGGSISSLGSTKGCTGTTFTFPFSSQCFNNSPGTQYFIYVNDGTDTIVYTQENLPTAFTHTFDSTSCGTTSLGQSNTFAISYLIINPCDITPGNIGGIKISRKAKANFTVSPYDTICVNTTLNFNNTSIRSLEVPSGNSDQCILGKIIWTISPSTGWSIVSGSLGSDLGFPQDPDSWVSGSDLLSINFTQPGIYSVKIKTGNTQCGADSMIKTICVNPIPTAAFTLSPNTGCSPLRVNATSVTNTPTCGSNTYNWTVSYAPTDGCAPNASDYAFVNGTNSSSQNPQFNFISPGVYTIGLQTFSPKARCSSAVVTQTVTVKSKPIVTLSGIPATLCQNVAITPSATATCYIDASTTYAWTFSNATPSTSTQLNPGSVLFNAPGNQTVALTATNTCGPTTAQQIVNVLPVPTVTPKPDVAYCNGTAVPAIVFAGSSVANTTYNWTNNNTNTGIAASGSGSIPAFTATNTTNAPIISIITVTPIANNCPGTSDIFNITVNPTPTVNDPADQTVCNGTSTAAVTFGGSAVAGTTYSWTNNTTSIGLAASGTGNIVAFTATNTTNAPVVATITVTATANNCPSIQQTFTITVNPTPTVNDPANQTVCNGNPISAINFSGNNVSGVVYNWTNNTPSINLAASGSGNIAVFNAANSTSSPVVATITVTPVANGCSGTPQTFTITVNPAPVVTFSPANQNICSGATSSLVTLNTTTTGVTVNFNWTATQPTGITGVATSGTSTIPTQTLTNTTNAPITIPYQATGTISGGTPCPGSQFTYQITVHPKPNASATNQTICSNTATSIALNTTTTPATAVTYGWTPSINANVTGASASSGATIAQTLSNSVSTPQNITYTITPTYTSGSLTCTGSTQTVIATVNPVPNVTQPSNIIVCNNTSTGAINFATTVTETTYSWTNSNTTIGLLAPTGTGNISAFTGLNSGTSPTFTTIAVTPNFTNTSGPTCPGAPKSFTITVNPTPTVTTVGNVTICHNSSSTAIPFSGAVTNTVYEWSNSNTAIGLGASGTGTIPVFTGTNAGTAPITATITVTPKFTNSAAATPVCSGTPITFTITINPRPTVTATPATQSICSGAQVNIALSSNISTGVTYNSVLTGSTNIGGATTTTSNPINQTLTNSSSTAQTVTYTVTPTYTNNSVGCNGPTTTSTVTVNPAPDVTQPNNVTFCNNTSTSVITFSGAVTGTNFAWTNNNTSIGLGASGTGNIPSFTTTNAGTTPITATIQVTPSLSSATGCSGVVKSFIITINPTPAATATPTTATICSGTAPSIALTSSITTTAGTTTYNWSPSTNLNITGASSSTGTPIAQTLNNTATSPQSITYSITPTYTNNLVACAGSPITATVTVNPVPTVNQPTSLVRCTNTTTGNISFSSTVTGTVYSWTNDNTNIGLAASGNGDINSFTVTNTTNAPIIANITVTPKYLLSGTTYCIGTTQTFTITVNPTPTVIMPTSIVICNGTTTGLISFSSLVNNTTFPWTNSQTSIGLAASGTGNISAFNGINSTSSSVVATISVIPTNVNAGVTCTGATQTFTITVNPAPNVTFSPSPQTICSGQSSTVVTLGSSTSGVTYSWSSTSPATVTGATASGTTGTITSQTLINNSNIPQTVVYSAVASTGGAAACPGGSSSYNIIVNPKPVVPAETLTICSEDAFTLTLTNNPTTTIIPANTTYTWTVASNTNVTGQSNQTASTGTISQTLTNSSNSQQLVVYTITPTSGAAGSCVGTPFTLTVNVDPRPKITNINASVCSGSLLTVSIPANNPPTVILPANTTYTWTFADNVNVTGESNESTGQSTITQTLVNTTNVPQNVVYTVTPKTGNCDGPTFTVTVTVNPAPYISDTTAVTCSGTLFSVTPANGVPTAATVIPANTTYTWTVVNNTDVSGDANQTSPQPSISQTLTNNTNVLQTIVYTVIPVSGAAGSCAGTPFTLTVTLNTKPVIPAQTETTCSGIPFSVSPQNGVPNASTIVPNGTTYTWTVAPNSVVTGASNQTTPQTSIGQTLVNTTNTNQTVVYTVTPLIGTCAGATFTVTVTVTPAPIIPNQTATICSDAAFTITPTNAPTATIVPSGTTYTWTVVDNVNVSGDLNETTAQPSISQTLTNNTNVVQTVVYTVTPKSGSCTGATFSVTVTVNPKPVVPAETLTICSADAFTLTLTNNPTTTIIPANTTYTWTVASNTNVTGQSNQTASTGTISQTLTNSSNSQQLVVYTITPTSGVAGSCLGSPFTLNVKVDPRPKITPIIASVCSGLSLTVSIPANNPPTVILPANTTYTWTFADNVNVTGESNESTGQSTITQTLVNITNVPQNVVYVVTPKTGNCSGPTFTVTVTVNPAPYISDTTAVTCSGTLFSVTPANGVPTAATIIPAGTQYTWFVAPNADVTGESNQTIAQSSISQTLTNTSNINQSVVYTVNPVSGAAGSCIGTPFTLTVTLNTKPLIPNQSVSTCSAIAFTVPLTNNPPTTILPSGTTYTWTVVDNVNVTGDSNQITPVLNLSQTLTNTTNTPQIVQYNVTPGIGNCTGTPFALSVTINPAPIVPNQTDTICSGDAFTLPLLVNNPPSYIIPNGTTYTWTVVDNPNISGDVAQTIAQNSVSQSLVNNSNVPQIVTYTVTPLFGNCVGNSFSVVVTVNPKPVIPNQNIVFCSGNLFTFNPTNNPPTVIIPNNTTYEWTISNNTNITGQSSSTSPQSSIIQTLTNNSNTPQVITYTITPTSGEQGNCPGQVVIYTITINPAPVFPTMFDTICSGNTFDSIPRNNPPLFIVPAGTTYSWNVPNMPTGIGPDLTSGTSGGVATTSPQNQILGTLTNTAYNPLNVTYSVTPSSPNSTGTGCAGAPFNYVVTVNPLPVISNNPLSQSICNETSSNSITFTSFTDNSTYNWNTIGTTTITGQTASGSGNLPSMLLTNAGLAQDVVTYAVTTTANACAGPATNYTIFVNPDATALYTYLEDTACWPFRINITNTSPQTADSAYYWYATHTINNTLITTLIGTGYNFPGDSIVLPDDSVMIRLITISKYGCKPDTLDHWFFTRYKPRPNFTFTYSPASGCGPNTVTFNNTTPYQVWFDYQWNFGAPPNPQTPAPNPANSTLAQPGSVLYQSDQLDFMDATYNVLLTVSNVCETKDTTIPVIIRSLPKARFAPDQTNVCSNTLLTFTNTSLGMDVTYHWDFGDGTDTNTTNLDPVQHAYNVGDTATFYAVLTATNSCGIDVDTVIIRVTPSTIDLNWFIVQNTQFGCAPHRVEIRNVSTGGTQFVWNFNDPNSPANYVSSLNSEVIYHTYTTPGIYDISVRATNACSDTSGVKQVRVIRTPITAFDIVNNNACPLTPVSFLNQTDTATNYTWNFGDPASGLNNTSILQNPSHVYTQPGVYVVTLTANLVDITGVSCPKEIRDTVYVVAPIVQISSNPTGCIKDTILFTPIVSSVLGLPPIQDTIWQINGVPYTVPAQEYPNFSHVFTLPGTYTITLIVGTITGCYDTVSTTITINILPTISASADQRICLGQSVQLNANSNVGNYQWTPLSGLSCYNCSNPIANPTTSTNYVVSTLNTFGCKNTDTVIITVIQPFDITVSPNDTICIGESATLTVSGASNYVWTPSATLSCSTCPNPIATPIITTTYTVIGSDNYRCFTDTGKVVVAVGKYPVVTLPAPQILSTGMLYPIVSQITNGPIRNYDWNPATNLSCDNCANPIAFIKKDVCYSLEAENIYGCKGSDTFCIRVFCENTQAFIPNTFTPDGDGINDIFMVRGTGIKSVKQFRIFNRWGELIFEKSNFPPNSIQYGWDGKVRGVPAIPDVFVYTAEVLCENDVPFTYKGNVTLIK